MNFSWKIYLMLFLLCGTDEEKIIGIMVLTLCTILHRTSAYIDENYISFCSRNIHEHYYMDI